MAGCLPEYLPWVLTVVEAICTDEFNIHGVLATTMPVGPVIIASGPGTRAIGMNAGVNALGQGNRANLTIGRAVQLVVRNVGGGRPGEVDRAAHGNPGKLSFCFAELADSPFATLAESRGRDARRRRRHGVRRRGSALHRRPDVADAGEPGDVAGRRACGRCTTRSSCSASTPSWCSGPSTAACSPRPAGTGRSVLAELDAACRSPATSSSAAPAAWPRACRSRSPARRCRSSGPAGSCSPTRAAAPGCSRR